MNKCYYCKKKILEKEILKQEVTYYLDLYKPIHKNCLVILTKILKTPLNCKFEII